MTTNEFERLIAMLEPSADADAVDFVRRELAKVCVPFPELTSKEPVFPESEPDLDARIDDWSCTSQGEVEHRTDQQAVDVFDSWLPDDPRNW